MPGKFLSALRSLIRLSTRKTLLLAIIAFVLLIALGGHLVQAIAHRAGERSSTAQPSATSFLSALLNKQTQVAGAGQISERALKQIQALIREKSSRTAAQKKMDVAILDTVRMRRNEPIAAGVPRLQTNVNVDVDETILLDISAEVTDNLIRQIESTGGQVSSSFPQFNTLRARVPATEIERLAELNEVKLISRAAQARTHSGKMIADRSGSHTAPQPRPRIPFDVRASHIRSQLPTILASLPKTWLRSSRAISALTGSVNSQGDRTHNADIARATFGVNGTGIKIGVLSDSVDRLAESQASGDLGPVTVLPGQSGNSLCNGLCSGEGTAILEVIHDLAPGAQLFFATAFISPAGFAQNILDLRAAGCDIIVDDVEYFNESPFQDGIVAQAVNSVTADGALYFAAAGNDGNLSDNTSGVWEGNFVNGGAVTIDGHPATAHSYGATTLNTAATAQGFSSALQLFWSDPLGASANDYDLYIVSSDGATVFYRSDNYQTGTQDPYELVGPLNQGDKILIVLYQGSPRFLHLEVINGTLSIATTGRTKGHSAAADALSVAATPAAAAFPGLPTGPVGPFPNPFNSTSTVELFSSDGPRRVFFNADGTPITPGNFLATGGAVRQKPDLTAADGIVTTFPSNTGLNPFFGTSAAAPHAAAIAALLKSYAPALNASQIRSILKSTALDIEAPGVDSDSGAGIVMANLALQVVTNSVILGASPTSFTVAPTQSATYTINLARNNFSGSVTLSATGLPTGASAIFNPGPATGNSSTLTINTSASTPVGVHTITINGAASGITVFPVTVTLIVTSPCAYTLNPNSQNFTVAGGTGTVNLTAGAGCVWTAVSQASWITITSGGSGSGNGNINFSIASNNGYLRVGTMKIAGRTFTATQVGAISGQWTPTGSLNEGRRDPRLVLLQNGKVLVAGGYYNNPSVRSELYDPDNGTWTYTGSLFTGRGAHTATLLQNSKVLVTGGQVANDAITATAELYDPATGTWTTTGSMTAERVEHTAILLTNGKLLVIGGYNVTGILNSTELYDPATGAWSNTGSMNVIRLGARATMLQNGKVLVVGGIGPFGRPTETCELYDPLTGTWSLTGGMFNRRYSHQVVILQNGKVLVMGGDQDTRFNPILDSAELYDPATGLWSQTDNMTDFRATHTATLLPNGKVLVAGSGFSSYTSAELYDPTTARWTTTSDMTQERAYGLAAILLSNGKVLVVSNQNAPEDATAELYDPNSPGKWSNTGSMNAARWAHTATLLQNGKVLVTGGNGGNNVLNSTELYDPAIGIWRMSSPLQTARRNHTATLLANGKVLVVGGFISSSIPGPNGATNPAINAMATVSAELYDPATGIWTTVGSLNTARGNHTATLLLNGKVLVAGGINGVTVLASAELYDPNTGNWSPTGGFSPGRTNHTATLLQNGKVIAAFGLGGLGEVQSYNPATGIWNLAGATFPPTAYHTATLLQDGTVLTTGGLWVESTSFIRPLSDCDIHDPFTGSWLPTNDLNVARFNHTATLLPVTGQVLITGGDNFYSGTINRAELYTPVSGRWRFTDSMNTPRELHTATLLPNGKVLVAGGANNSQSLNSAELYDQAQGCAFSLNPASQNFAAGGGSGSFNISTVASCPWVAASNADWITITGVPSGSGNGVVQYSVAANTGNTRTSTINVGSQVFTVNQSSGCGAITINPATLFSGFVNSSYSQTLTATGGTAPYSFSVIQGALPPGLGLSPGGVLSGTPSATGTYNFTVRATSVNGCPGERAYTLQIGNIDSVKLQYYPLPAPVRLLDTRPGENACFAPGSPLGVNSVRQQQATGACSGIPAAAKAVVGNATVVNFISNGGFITLFPSDATQPNASNLNFTANHIVPNSFTVGLGADGAFKIFTSAATHFIVDVTGYYAPPGQGGLYFHPLSTSLRLLDTRQDETACETPAAPLANDGTRTVTAHRSCLGATIPSSAKAIVGNATVVNFISSGFHWITLYPFGATQPNASNLNFTANQIVPNAFVVGLSNDGKFNIYSHASTDLIIDVAGYFSDQAVDINGQGLLYNPLPSPVRLLDTRPGESGCDAPGAPLGNDATRSQFTHRTCFGVPVPNTAKAVVGNGTVVNFISSGFHWITFYPFGAALPNASNLNFSDNQIVPNSFVVGLSNDGRFNIYSHASTHFIVDLTGYFTP
jgi:N-acetylneuraminic acid mutarotase